MIHNIADVTPAGTATQLTATATRASWVQISAPGANAGELRAGDSTTGAASGTVIGKGLAVTFQTIGDTESLDISSIYVYGTGSDKACAVYGKK